MIEREDRELDWRWRGQTRQLGYSLRGYASKSEDQNGK